MGKIDLTIRVISDRKYIPILLEHFPMEPCDRIAERKPLGQKHLNLLIVKAGSLALSLDQANVLEDLKERAGQEDGMFNVHLGTQRNQTSIPV